MGRRWISVSGGLLAAQLIACGSEDSSGSLLDGRNGGSATTGEVGTGEVGEAIVDGTTDSADKAVLAIALVTRREEALCSGSLIAPNLVLTARHCVAVTADAPVVCGSSTFGSPYAPDELFVSDATTAGSGNFYPTREIAVPSDDSELCGSDVALLILDGQFQVDSVPALSPRLDQPVHPDEAFTAIGFGEALDAGPAGVRRVRSGLRILCGPNDCQDSNLTTDGEFVGQQGVCEGDSGGPAVDTHGRVVGVASRATDGCGLAVYSAVATWGDWMRSVAARAAELGSYDVPAWETSESAAAAASPRASGTSATPALPEPATSAPDARVPMLTSHPASSGCDLTSHAAGGLGRSAWLAPLALVVTAVRRRVARSQQRGQVV